MLFSCCTSAQHPLSRKHPIQIQSKLFNFRNNRFRQAFAFWELFLENHLKGEAFFLLKGTAIGSSFIGGFFFLVFLPEGKGQTKLGETEIYFFEYRDAITCNTWGFRLDYEVFLLFKQTNEREQIIKFQYSDCFVKKRS